MLAIITLLLSLLLLGPILFVSLLLKFY